MLARMVEENEIWRAANLLIKRHGRDGAAQRADELLDQGDLEGQAVWKRILRAVEEMLSDRPKGSVH